MCHDCVSVSYVLLLPCAVCLYGSMSSGQVFVLYVVLPHAVLNRVVTLDRDVSRGTFWVDESDVCVLWVLPVASFVVLTPSFSWWPPVVLLSPPSSPSVEVVAPRRSAVDAASSVEEL